MLRNWEEKAIAKIQADFTRSSDTHLIRVDLPNLPDIHLYLKDESTHPTGSLKHRLARSLFFYGLCSGWIHEDTTIIEASSGSTAVSEAYFAKLLGLPFIAVMPKTTAQEKKNWIEFYGGQCDLVEKSSQIYERAKELAIEKKGHYMDQFTYAERATDWRGNNNIAKSIFQQMEKEPHPIPSWIVVGAGTGGTSATIGRYARYNRTDTGMCVVDPENSVFYDYYHYHKNNPERIISDPSHKIFYQSLEKKKPGCKTVIEGIGRPRVEPSFLPDIIDHMIQVPNAAAIASIRFLEGLIGRKCGGSTGTNLYGAFQIIAKMVQEGKKGSVVSMICDPGDRYLNTYYSDDWLKELGCDITPYLKKLEDFYQTGKI